MALSLAQGSQIVLRKAEDVSLSDKLPWAIIGLGIVLRFIFFAAERALFIDEAGVALNIAGRSFAGLSEPLDFAQGAPYGWLLIQKAAVETLGNSERALRLLPQLAGIASLFLFYSVAKQMLSRHAASLALALFAITWPLVNYSSLVKQYSTDVAIGLLLLVAWLHVYRKGLTAPWLLAYAVLGAAVVWLSHPSVFVLGGIGTVAAYQCVRERQWATLAKLLPVYGAWLVSFGSAFFLTSGRSMSASGGGLVRHFQSDFMPLPPTSISDIQWFTNIFFQVFDDPVGISLSSLGVFGIRTLKGHIDLVKMRITRGD